MDFKDLIKLILALFGIGGAAVLSTGAWSVPQSGVYSQLLPAPQWMYAGDTVSCIWEIHPNTTKTINSVSYGAPGNWTACTQNTSDFLLWTCNTTTVAEGNTVCSGIRVVQNEYPGTSETTVQQNYTFKTASAKGSRFPGCTSADCVITSGASIPAGTYFMRNLKIGEALTLAGNVNLTVTENFTILPTGSISFGSSTAYHFNVTTYRFNNSGTINGNGNSGTNANGCPATGTNTCGGCNYPSSAGSPAGNMTVKTAYFFNSGSISLVGGLGGAASACCQGLSPWYGTVCVASVGGAGGTLAISPHAWTNNTGTISLRGGDGGVASSACCGGVCSAAAADGGIGGTLIANTTNLSSSAAITTQGGQGGNSASCTGGANCCTGTFCRAGPAGNGGAGGSNKHDVSLNLSILAAVTSLGGSGGAGAGACGAGATGTSGTNIVAYCANGTGMNWANYNPTATTSPTACLSAPVVSFVVPNSSSNVTAYLQNISVNVTQPGNISLLISISSNNGSTWTWLSPDIYSLPFNVSNNGTPYLDTHRMGSDYPNYSLMRVIAYNSSSKIYSDPVEVAFNLTDIQTNVSASSSPSGVISTNTILFTCNYTNMTDEIEAATPYLILDGTAYAMSFNNTAKTYYWNNNQTLLAGPHWWRCSMDKANYRSFLGTNTSINVSGFGIVLASGQTSVKLACPFPTISGMTPAGQKAGIGIFRIVNYNSTALHNYSLFLNNTVPPGVTVYARCDRFSPQLTGWTALSTDTGYKGLLDINSTNSSAYCWLRMDCVSATPGTYTPIDYVFTEE